MFSSESPSFTPIPSQSKGKKTKKTKKKQKKTKKMLRLFQPKNGK
jgi:hypothetical protein